MCGYKKEVVVPANRWYPPTSVACVLGADSLAWLARLSGLPDRNLVFTEHCMSSWWSLRASKPRGAGHGVVLGQGPMTHTPLNSYWFTSDGTSPFVANRVKPVCLSLPCIILCGQLPYRVARAREKMVRDGRTVDGRRMRTRRRRAQLTAAPGRAHNMRCENPAQKNCD